MLTARHQTLGKEPKKAKGTSAAATAKPDTASLRLFADEIAAILNRKEATIRWRLAEARLRFKEIWLRRQSAEATSLPIPHATDRPSDVQSDSDDLEQ